MSGSGFTGQFTEGDDEDSLSPEACYECKINGGGKNGRHKRNTDENHIQQVPSAAASWSGWGSPCWQAAVKAQADTAIQCFSPE